MPSEFFLAHIWLIPLFPLAGAATMLLFGRRLNNAAVSIICPGSVFLSMCFAFGAIFQLIARPVEQRVVEVVLFDWVPAGAMHLLNGRLAYFDAQWGMLLDPLSAVMLFVVTGVGFLIHVSRPATGPRRRLLPLLRLLESFHVFDADADPGQQPVAALRRLGRRRPLQLPADLVFYFLRKSASDAGKKAFIVNRVGDAGFVLGLFGLLSAIGTIRFTEIGPALQAGGFEVGNGLMTAVALLLFVGATGKSAQLPLYVWLPDAMEGPTPVSALIHAATMVTAGVYMVTRMNAVFQLAPTALTVVATVGASTAIFAASIGLVQNDIKRVLAYSTVSQLGSCSGLGVGALAAESFTDDPRFLEGLPFPGPAAWHPCHVRGSRTCARWAP